MKSGVTTGLNKGKSDPCTEKYMNDPEGSNNNSPGNFFSATIYFILQKFSSFDKEEYPTGGRGRWLDFTVQKVVNCFLLPIIREQNLEF